MVEQSGSPKTPKPTSEQPDVNEPSNVRHPDEAPEPQEMGGKSSSGADEESIGE
jgi:hypothetical protein